MSLLKLAVIVALVWLAVHQCQQSGQVTLGPGIKAEQAPRQINLKQTAAFRHDDFTIIPLAVYELEAKVLSKENYYLGEASDLSPTDLALGWQKMSDESLLDHIKIRQSGRWYHWRVKQLPMPMNDIQTQSANVHIVPGNDLVKMTLKRVKSGQVIKAKGFLIRAEKDGGWYWQSSLTRTDTGGGSCELFYVSELDILNTD